MPSLEDMPREVILQALGYGMLVPAAVTVVAMLLMLRMREGPAVAVTLGLFAGFAALAATGQIGWDFLLGKIVNTWNYLPGLAILAAVFSPFRQVNRISALARGLVCLVAAGLTAWLLGRAEAATESLSPWWYVSLAAAVVALWALLDPIALRWPGYGLPTLLALIAFGAAAIGELSGVLSYAHLGGVLGAVLSGVAVVGWLRPTEPLARAAVPAVAVMLPGLLFLAFRNDNGGKGGAGLPAASYLLVLAAPLLLGATPWLPFGRSALLRIGAVLLPLGVGLALAALA